MSESKGDEPTAEELEVFDPEAGTLPSPYGDPEYDGVQEELDD